MNEPAMPAAADALAAVYGNITAATGGLGEAALMMATRCTGWVAGDLLYHQLLDARRALTTLSAGRPRPGVAGDRRRGVPRRCGRA
jgi:Mycothiol maleylpyruvate isomerase N-terminal domain